MDDRRVVPGMKAACTIDAYPDRAYEGRVTEIAAFAQEMERFSTRRGFPGRIELDATARENFNVSVEAVKELLEACKQIEPSLAEEAVA